MLDGQGEALPKISTANALATNNAGIRIDADGILEIIGSRPINARKMGPRFQLNTIKNTTNSPRR